VATVETGALRGDYEALREGCALVDRSERGKLALTGAGAVEFLGGQVTNELADLRPGAGRYAAFLTNKGKMLGDLRVLAVGEEPATPGGPRADAQLSTSGEPIVGELLLDTERVALQALFDMIRRYRIGYEVELHKRTLECGLLSLIGPQAHAVAARVLGLPREPTSGAAAGAPALPSSEHAHMAARLAGRPLRLIGTVEGGLDVLCDAADLEAVSAALQEAGARPVGEPTAEIVRVERGCPRFGIDMDESTIPQEAGLNERAVSFTKGCYVGQETVARLHYKGRPNRHLRGLRISEPAHPLESALRADTGAELHLGERLVGHLGSVVRSPTFGPIGLALLRREAAPGDIVAVGGIGVGGETEGIQAEVLELPFR
jgi:folate-binding protein YgfZ